MGSILESSYLRQRLQEIDQMYPKPSTLGQCDCTSYSYVGLSVCFFSIGTYITVLALGNIDGYLFSNLGHMWLVGPIFICSGLMIAVKSVLYLRRKSVIQMLLRQRVFLRGLQQIAQQSVHNQTSQECRNASTLTLPPVYEALMEDANTEVPPPTYEEAMFMVGGNVLKDYQDNEKVEVNTCQCLPCKEELSQEGTSTLP